MHFWFQSNFLLSSEYLSAPNREEFLQNFRHEFSYPFRRMTFQWTTFWWSEPFKNSNGLRVGRKKWIIILSYNWFCSFYWYSEFSLGKKSLCFHVPAETKICAYRFIWNKKYRVKLFLPDAHVLASFLVYVLHSSLLLRLGNLVWPPYYSWENLPFALSCVSLSFVLSFY